MTEQAQQLHSAMVVAYCALGDMTLAMSADTINERFEAFHEAAEAYCQHAVDRAQDVRCLEPTA